MWKLALILLALLAGLQYYLWVGDGGVVKVRELKDAIEVQKGENRRLKERNSALEAEVLDLKQGFEAIEERARSELGMVREGETFYQVVE